MMDMFNFTSYWHEEMLLNLTFYSNITVDDLENYDESFENPTIGKLKNLYASSNDISTNNFEITI